MRPHSAEEPLVPQKESWLAAATAETRAYVCALSDRERLALEVARGHFGRGFDVRKTNGYAHFTSIPARDAQNLQWERGGAPKS